MIIEKNIKSLNTFGFDVKAKGYVEFASPEELTDIFKEIGNLPFLTLGGGSNILFTKDFDGVIIHPVGKNIELVADYKDYVLLRADAGVEWDDFVLYCINNGYYGAENLSGIPGSVGASPVQNIGAYGVEAKDIIESVEYFDIELKKHSFLSNDRCHFGYRNSIFKEGLKGVVTAVIFRLEKKFSANLSYRALAENVDMKSIDALTLRNAIIELRNSKLPSLDDLGNGGSFFKNPVVSVEKYNTLITQYSDMPSYPDSNGIKLSAAWLIDRAGWRGHRSGAVGVYEKQALVLVHYGGGCGEDIVNLANNLIDSVNNKYGVTLTPEVIIC